ncbi:hypothetical protein PC111_g15844 [Phytophthora cactorum]|nr:hypothetical protein PC111_g15844 [Phytophthora cactorum]
MTTPIEHARGEVDCQNKHRAVVTPGMKEYIKEMDETGLAPRHIGSGLRRCAGTTPLNGQPSCDQVVRCVQYLRVKNGEHHTVNSIKALLREFPMQSGIDEDKAFMFGPTLDDDGFAHVYQGEDNSSFIIKVTTIGLLEKFQRQLSKYHLTAMFVVTQLTQYEYAGVLSGLLQVYHKLLQVMPMIDPTLGDAEDAQYNDGVTHSPNGMQHVGDAPGDSSVQVAMAVDVQGVPQETMKINVQGVANEKVEPEVQDSGQPDEQEMLSVDDGLDNIQGGGHENPNLASLGSCFSVTPTYH